MQTGKDRLKNGKHQSLKIEGFQNDTPSLFTISSITLMLGAQSGQVLDFHEMSNAGDCLVAALSLSRYQNVKHINLEFARDIEDKHLEIVKNKCGNSIGNLVVLNLNGCQKISDVGIDFITYNCPNIRVFSIYWNVRVSNLGIQNLVKNCKLVINLNLSGCKSVTDESLKLIAENYLGLLLLNLTRCCVKKNLR